MIRKTIFKYEVPSSGVLYLPKGASVLKVGLQYDDIHLWAMVDPTQPIEARRFMVYGTGNEIDQTLDLKYIDTVIVHGGLLVLHVFESNLTSKRLKGVFGA